MLFNSLVNGWQSWGKVFQNISAFSGLIEHIFARHQLSVKKIDPLTPGTHGVFLVNEKYVIKLFAPKESGLDPWVDFEKELLGMAWAEKCRVAASRVLFKGLVDDRYQFYYLVMDYIEGRDAGQVLFTLNTEQKTAFGKKLRQTTDSLFLNPGHRRLQVNIKEKVRKDTRWQGFSPAIKKAALTEAEAVKLVKNAYVHGDLTGENIRINDDQNFFIIDFADGLIAPQYYDWPPVVIELFSFDHQLLNGFFGVEYKKPAFVKVLAKGILIHDFGEDLLKTACKQIGLLSEVKAVKSIADIEAILRENLLKRG